MFKALFRFFRGSKSSPELDERLEKLQAILEVQIEDAGIFSRALRHRSTLGVTQLESHDSYERLEFLGDAVLDLIVSEILYSKFPKRDEGFLTKTRAKIVKGESLAVFSQKLGLKEMMEVGERTQYNITSSILADVFESLVAAIYLTKGYSAAFKFVQKVIDTFVDFEELTETLDNFKSALLEYSQAQRKSQPVYKVIHEAGPGHDRIFTVQVSVDGDILGIGTGKNKKKAEQAAAKEALLKIHS